MKILISMEITDTHKQWFLDATQGHDVVFKSDAEVTAADLVDADIVIGNPAPSLLPQAAKLRWLQLGSAGSDAYVKPGLLKPGVDLTNATGAFGLAISEHMVGVLLAMMKKLYLYHDNQKACNWQDEGMVTSIYGSTVLVVGMGDIGGRFARLCKGFGAYVIGIRRRSVAVPEYADEMGTMDRLDEYLARADVVATVLPNTPATYHLYDKNRFAAMKKGAYFINVGRGNAVVTEDLCDALRSGHLAGASVDVTDPEPLPADNPAWKEPNMHITPHVSGYHHLQATHDNIVNIAIRNLQAFFAGEPLENQVDFATGYKK